MHGVGVIAGVREFSCAFRLLYDYFNICAVTGLDGPVVIIDDDDNGSVIVISDSEDDDEVETEPIRSPTPSIDSRSGADPQATGELNSRLRFLVVILRWVVIFDISLSAVFPRAVARSAGEELAARIRADFATDDETDGDDVPERAAAVMDDKAQLAAPTSAPEAPSGETPVVTAPEIEPPQAHADEKEETSGGKLILPPSLRGLSRYPHRLIFSSFNPKF